MAIYAGLSLGDVFDVVQTAGPARPWTESATVYAWWEGSYEYRAVPFSGLGGELLDYTLTVKPGKQVDNANYIRLFCNAGAPLSFAVNNESWQEVGPGTIGEYLTFGITRLRVVPDSYGSAIALAFNPEAILTDIPPTWQARWTRFIRSAELGDEMG